MITAQKSRFGVRELLTAAYAQEPNEKAALFRIIGEIADASRSRSCIGRVQGKDPIARVHIINTLARFNTPEVQTALQGLLKDPNKLIRGAALSALQRMDGPDRRRAGMRAAARPGNRRAQQRDRRGHKGQPSGDHPATSSTCSRTRTRMRGARAVEVLNEIGNAKSVKYLLEALKDSDWWVRSRAADALGKIGGPKVIDAVLQLVRDKDEDIRRAAIEILNQTKDERAVESLIQATRDCRLVGERARRGRARRDRQQARRAAPHGNAARRQPTARRRRSWCARSASSATRKLVDTLLPLIARPEREIRIEAMQALSRVADESRAEQVRTELQAQAASPDQTISRMAAAARDRARQPHRRHRDARARRGRAHPAGGGERHRRTGVRPPQAAPEAARTVVITEQAAQRRRSRRRPRRGSTSTTLKPGDIIEGRYKYIDRIGRGAFGTVLLMEDTVVDERLILKFLNPNVSQDEEVMKRFVHELRYSRKITHKNVIRIYDFLYIQGSTRSRWSTSPRIRSAARS